MTAPPYSQNARMLLEFAVAEAIKRNHDVVGTEHLVYSICQHRNVRAINWMAARVFPNICIEDAINNLINEICSYLESRCLFQYKENLHEINPPFSAALNRVMDIAIHIGNRPVRDGDTIISNGIIASEFLLAGIILEGTSVGATALTRGSQGKINTYSILSAINISPQTILNLNSNPEMNRFIWNCETNNISFLNPTDLNTCSHHDSYCFHTLLDMDALGTFPLLTDNSNWIIPNKLLIGEYPSSTDVIKIISPPNDLNPITLTHTTSTSTRHKSVNIFVNLIGEMTSSQYVSSRYPQSILQHFQHTYDNNTNSLRASNCHPSSDISFFHYPINDFSVITESQLISLINELKTLLLNPDNVLYVHCRGGHGRTGMVVTALLIALYDISFNEAQSYVENATKRYRISDRGSRYLSMPETDEQCELVKKIEFKLRKHLR